MFRRFGSQVTVVQRGEQLLAREDPDVADAVASILQEDEVGLLLKTEAVKVAKSEQGKLQVTARTPEGERVLSGSRL